MLLCCFGFDNNPDGDGVVAGQVAAPLNDAVCLIQNSSHWRDQRIGNESRGYWQGDGNQRIRDRFGVTIVQFYRERNR